MSYLCPLMSCRQPTPDGTPLYVPCLRSACPAWLLVRDDEICTYLNPGWNRE